MLGKVTALHGHHTGTLPQHRGRGSVRLTQLFKGLTRMLKQTWNPALMPDGMALSKGQGKEGRGMKGINKPSSKYFTRKHSTGLTSSSHPTLSNTCCSTNNVQKTGLNISVPLVTGHCSREWNASRQDAGLTSQQEHQSLQGWRATSGTVGHP